MAGLAKGTTAATTTAARAAAFRRIRPTSFDENEEENIGWCSIS
jgi:hypothetical protein